MRVAEDTPLRRKSNRIRHWLFVLPPALGGVLTLWLVAVWPPPIWYRWSWPRETAFMSLRASREEELAKHPQRRKEAGETLELPRLYRPVPLGRIDPDLPTAVLIAKDHRFFEHRGVDYQAIREALG